MLKKYLSEKNYVVALEVNKNDFGFFNEKDMYSVNQNNLSAAIKKFDSASYILVDINNEFARVFVEEEEKITVFQFNTYTEEMKQESEDVKQKLIDSTLSVLGWKK